MDGVVSILALAVMMCLCSFTDLSVILAPVQNCSVVRRSALIPAVPLLICAGSFLTAGSSGAAGIDAAGVAIICLGALGAVAAGRLISAYRPSLWAFTGAAAGYSLFRNGDTGGVKDWLLAAAVSLALAALTAALLCRAISLICRHSRKHRLILVRNLGICTSLAAALMLVCAGANISLIRGSFPLAADGRSGVALALAAGTLVALPFLGRSIGSLGERQFDLNYDVILATVCSVAVVCALFSSDAAAGCVGCKATVMSPGLLAFAALGGCSAVKRQEYMSGAEAARLALSGIGVPLTALVLTCLTLMLIYGAGNLSPVRVMVLAVALLALISGTVIYTLYSRSRHSGQALRDQEEQINENRHTLNSLEVKNMTIENEHLRNQLELKRQELLSVAMNITEQKEFIGRLNGMVKQARLLSDPAEKDRALHEISAQLSLRMNFDNEIDRFYTQVEQLHKDFTVRLQEKFPQLTAGERRLTTLLRLGFSTKYIAALMNIAPKSAEICRHRLRSKFGLDRKQSLTDFIKSI